MSRQPVPIYIPPTNYAEPDPCPICERPNYFPSDHHMVPRRSKQTFIRSNDSRRRGRAG